MKKTHINSLKNLLNNYSKEEIIDQISTINFDAESIKAYKEIFATEETAIAWFKNFCAQYNLTIVDGRTEPKSFDRMTIKEFAWNNGNDPYFMLWLNEHGPHVELGGSYYDLWGATGLADLETKMHKIMKLREEG